MQFEVVSVVFLHMVHCKHMSLGAIIMRHWKRAVCH